LPSHGIPPANLVGAPQPCRVRSLGRPHSGQSNLP
jgi:hypothetical protein